MPAGLFHETYRSDERIFQTKFVWFWLTLFLAACVFVPPLLSKYIQMELIKLGIIIIAVHGLNILTGYTGQISLGHGAFIAVGAYTSAILTAKLGVPFLVALPAAGLMAATVGLVFGLPSLRLRGLYLALATIAAQFIILFAIRRMPALTGGTEAMDVPHAAIGPWTINPNTNPLAYYYLVLVVVVLATWATKNLVRSRTGRAFIAVRDRYLAAEVIGVNLFKYRLMSFAVSSFFAGVAGSLFAHYIESISWEQFTIGYSIEYLAMIIIGGLGSVTGAIFGATFVVVLERSLDWGAMIVPIWWPGLLNIISNPASVKEIIFGGIIIAFLIFEPDGLAARWRTVRSYWKLWPFSY